jgi:hypothetical protein
MEVIVLFCVAGGEEFKISGDTKIEGGLTLKKCGSTSSGEIKISKSEARGLAEGLRNEMSKVTGEQAPEARACMKPFIDRISNILLQKESDLDRTIRNHNKVAYGVRSIRTRGTYLRLPKRGIHFDVQYKVLSRDCLSNPRAVGLLEDNTSRVPISLPFLLQDAAQERCLTTACKLPQRVLTRYMISL